MEMEEYKRDACGSSLKEVAAFFDEIFPGKEKTLLRLCFPKQGLSTVCLDTKSVDSDCRKRSLFSGLFLVISPHMQ